MMYLKGVSTLKYDETKCINCLRCIEVCPHHVFTKGKETVRVDNKDRCIECGACQMNCTVNAITVDAGVGCASAIIYSKLKSNKLLNKFMKKDCC